MRVLLIDHYDSFTWNLAQLLGELSGELPEVVPHDDDRLASADWRRWKAIVLSPGPGTPLRTSDARYSRLALAPGRPPVLGVCLGMQLIAHEAGARVARAPTPMHGRLSRITHDGSRLFEGVPSPTEMVRYHSLACSDLPSTVRATAVAADGVLMALEHTTLPQWGVQFHPESIASEHGRTIVANFLRIAGIGPARTRPAPAPPLPADAPLLHEVIETRLDGERLFAEAFRDSPAAVWLDGIAEGSRFSVLGDDSGPLAHRLTYDAAARRITITDRAGTQVREGRLFDHLRALPRAPGVPDLPFALGYCGYFGYELRQDCGSPVRHRSPFADAQLLYLDRAVVLDHQEGRAHLLALPHPENERWLREMRLTNLPEVEAATPSAGRVTWRDSRETYRAKVMAAQEHLAAGESYELCLTNQASVRCPEDPFTVYQQLRRVNPAPYAAFLRLPGIAILSSSPELFLKVDRDGGVTARPIKGTRRRTAGDVGVVEDLRSSEKDRSENLMITDLLRNDLGRVCAIGSVRVPSLFAVESFATVHQLVSTVTGRLRPELGAIDLLEAAFPPGSMTGAPKLRSMALLEALEGAPRGPYSGAIGYLSRCGAAQLSVVIRTAVIADGSATIGVGGAVVALSDPDAEVAEMELKAEAVLTALGAGERSRPT